MSRWSRKWREARLMDKLVKIAGLRNGCATQYGKWQRPMSNSRREKDDDEIEWTMMGFYAVREKLMANVCRLAVCYWHWNTRIIWIKLIFNLLFLRDITSKNCVTEKRYQQPVNKCWNDDVIWKTDVKDLLKKLCVLVSNVLSN